MNETTRIEPVSPLDFFGIFRVLSDLYKGMKTIDVGIFVKLGLYCLNHPNRGRITGAGSWDTRLWMIYTGLDEKPADNPPYWHYDGNDLIVDLYPVEGEEKALALRKVRAESGKKGGASKKKQKANGKQKESKCQANAKQELSKSQANAKQKESRERVRDRDIYPLTGDISSRELAPGHADAAGAALEDREATPEEIEATPEEIEAAFREMREELKADQ